MFTLPHYFIFLSNYQHFHNLPLPLPLVPECTPLKHPLCLTFLPHQDDNGVLTYRASLNNSRNVKIHDMFMSKLLCLAVLAKVGVVISVQ